MRSILQKKALRFVFAANVISMIGSGMNAAAVAELLDDLVAAGEGGAGRQLSDGCLKGLCYDRRMVLGRRELGAATGAES